MPPTPWLLFTAVLAPVLTGLVTLGLPRKRVTLRVLLALAGPALAFTLVCCHLHDFGIAGRDAITHHDAPQAASDLHTAAAHLASGPRPTATLTWIPTLHLDISFLADGLGGFFALLVSGIGVLIVLYARGYFGGSSEQARADLYRFYPTLGFFTSAMMGLVLADHTLLTLVFWELTSISSFLLIGWDRYDKQAVKLAMQAFFTTGFGGMMLLGGLVVLGSYSGVWRWSDLYAAAADGRLDLSGGGGVMWAFVLMFIGAASKSAQLPFHYWLPGAMAAPTPVSAFLHSATMVKAGVYLVGRLLPALATLELWPWLVLPIGAATMVLGACIALNQHDLKRIFAYTTVSQLGLLMAMYALGSLSYHGHANIDFDITQIANHAFYKAPLFILAGALGHVASRDITQLNGVVRKHATVSVLMILAAYALAALPGSISFQAKELFLYAVHHSRETIGSWWIVLFGAAIVTSICNVAIFVRLTTTLLGLPGGMKPLEAEPESQHPGYREEEQDHPEVDAEPEPHYTGQADAPRGHDAPGDGHGHADHEHVHERGLWPMFLWIPALILMSFQFVGGLYTPLWNQVFGRFEVMTAHNYIGQHYGGVPALWQIGPGVPLLGSAIAVVGGVLLGMSPRFRGAIVDVADRIYPLVYKLAVVGGGRAFAVLQTGNQRHYVLMVIAVLVTGFAAVIVQQPEAMLAPLRVDLVSMVQFWPGILLGVVVCFSALMLPLVSSSVLRVLMLGACGFTVIALYLVYEAPDLALTQLMFEIISVVLFVLALRLLPHETPRPRKPMKVGIRVVASTAMGLTFGAMTLIAASATPESRLGTFFLRNSYKLAGTEDYGGGGFNVVNVILVDFRGFDTFGEITVLSIAALGVWTMLPSRRRRRQA